VAVLDDEERRAVATFDDRAKAKRRALRVDRADHSDAQQLRIREEVRHQISERGH